MKKLLAILLAVGMIMGLALTASAAETTLPDQTFDGWWTAWSQGIEITAEGVTITFHADTDDSTAANYCTPSLVIHDGSADAIGTEYWVQRSDAWGWCYAQNIGDHAAELNALGYSWNFTYEESFGSWENFQAVTKAGTDAEINAKLEGSNAVICYKIAGVVNEITIPVDTTKPVYLCLTGEKVALSNIVVTTPDPIVDEPAEPEVPAEDTVTEIYAGDGTAKTGWSDFYVQVNTTVWGGTIDPACFAEGGHLEVNITATDLYGVHLALNNGSWFQYDYHINPDECKAGTITDLGDGNYVVTFTYDEIVAKYGSDFSALGAIQLATNCADTGSVTVNSINYVVPAPEADDSNPKDGDSIAVVFALLAVSAAGIAVVAKKKEF